MSPFVSDWFIYSSTSSSSSQPDNSTNTTITNVKTHNKEKPKSEISRTEITRFCIVFCFRFSHQVSGLSKWVGSQLANLDAIPSYAIVMSVCIMITTFTEFTSNVATATIFLPILASLVSMITIKNSILSPHQSPRSACGPMGHWGHVGFLVNHCPRACFRLYRTLKPD